MKLKLTISSRPDNRVTVEILVPHIWAIGGGANNDNINPLINELNECECRGPGKLRYTTTCPSFGGNCIYGKELKATTFGLLEKGGCWNCIQKAQKNHFPLYPCDKIPLEGRKTSGGNTEEINENTKGISREDWKKAHPEKFKPQGTGTQSSPEKPGTEIVSEKNEHSPKQEADTVSEKDKLSEEPETMSEKIPY